MSLGVGGAIRCKRKTGASSDNRSHLYLMLKDLCRAICDEQSQSKPIRMGRLKTVKRFKDVLQVLRSDADPGIMNLDPDARAATAASKKNLTVPLCKLYRIAHEVADDACQQDGLTRDYRLGAKHSQPNSSLGGYFREFSLNR